MRTGGAGRAAAAAMSVTLALAAGCATDPGSGPAAACSVAPNGTPITTAPTAPGGRDIATAPEIPTGYRTGMTPVRTATYAAATANPVATEAACRVLADGGSAADALIVAQTVLGLVEPQSSGIGGGTFLLYRDGATGSVQAYDGRETAPAAATADYLRRISPADPAPPAPSARTSGRSIGVPGVLRMLQSAHTEHGRMPWDELFDPAIRLADNGFEISPRMAAAIADAAADLARDEQARDYFLRPDGSAKPEGTVLVNPAMAKTLGAVASEGADAFYTGAVAEDVVAATADTSGGRTAGALSTADLAGYRAIERTPVCTGYRDREVCGMPPPSSGGIAVAATLGMLTGTDLAALPPRDVDADGGVPDPRAVHLISEAERLAYADRDAYVADTDFVPLPGGSPDALVDPGYLAGRAALIDPGHSMGTARPGEFAPAAARPGEEHGTSQITVADRYGDVASMTTSIESAFGSFHMVDGFLLNNQLTDFSAEPAAPDGTPVANRVEPGKRPRSSMAPTLVFERNPDGGRGAPVLATGSPGGAVIIQFVVKTLVALLDWGLDPQQAVSLVDFGAANTPRTNVGGEHPGIDGADNGAHDPLVQALTALGHQVSTAPQSSGLSVLLRGTDGWIGGADPRREGAVTGDLR
ncbi:gamma-glutamyltransferase family protein [Rhodococcus olei]|uniref:Gamma-glutamyltransferase family protein n=2 Tax=Rhodococcus olei TaxID=2161675 RepID=A0ABP8NTD7_9NOCA